MTNRVEFGAAVDLELRPSDENVVNIRKRHVNISRLKTHQPVIQGFLMFFVDFLKGLQFHSFFWSQRSTVQLVFLDVSSPAFHEMPFRIGFKGPQETVRQQKTVSKTGEKATSHRSISSFCVEHACFPKECFDGSRCWE